MTRQTIYVVQSFNAGKGRSLKVGRRPDTLQIGGNRTQNGREAGAG
jgi:hypothetical protein